MKKFFAVLMLAAALILPGLAQAKDAQTSMIDDVVKRGVLQEAEFAQLKKRPMRINLVRAVGHAGQERRIRGL